MTDYENAPLEPPAMEEDSDDEFGAPEEVPIDLNRQINHAINSLTNSLGQAHWKVGQHAAEIDTLKMMLAEKENETVALCSALESEMEHSRSLEGKIEKLQYQLG